MIVKINMDIPTVILIFIILYPLVDYWTEKIIKLLEVIKMKELSTKGVEELGKLKNRVSRLYGMGRLSPEDFRDLDQKIINLENDLKEVKELGDKG